MAKLSIFSPKGDFKALVAQAASAKAELQRLANRDGRLSVKGYLDSISARRGFDLKHVAVIEKAMDGSDADLLRPALRGLTDVIHRFTPTSALRSDRMGPYIGEASEALGRLGVSRDALLYVAAKQAGKLWPAHFGTLDSEGDVASALARATAEWNGLKEKIETFPLTIGDADSDSDLEVIGEHAMPQPGGGVDVWVKLGFRCTGNAVSFTKDRAQHLATWWLEHVAIEEAA